MVRASYEPYSCVGDIRHHDLRISHPCPTNPRSCPPPLISYRPYQIELTTLTMTKANPMYLILGGSHPHAFLHDRRMTGRDMTKEWGTLQWNSDAATQVLTPSDHTNNSASADLVRMEKRPRHGGVCISPPVNSQMPDQMNS